MHEKRFYREIDRLRDPERIARLEVVRVVDLALAHLKIARSVLDVGTGSGLFAQQFSVRGLKVTGLDANPEMLPAARRYVPKGTFKEGIAEKLPFPDRSFDLVFMGLLLHETDDVWAALSEAQRVAKMRAAVLEWPDEEQDFGPPREHRLSAVRIASLSHQVGFSNIESIRLKNLVLYLIEKQ